MLPQFLARSSGRIVVVGSAAALRGQKRTSSYSAARGAQLDWARAAGVEPSQQNLRLNAIAQNLVDNPTYFPSRQAKPRKGGSQLKLDRNLSSESRGFNSLPVTPNQQPDASLTCECGNVLLEA